MKPVSGLTGIPGEAEVPPSTRGAPDRTGRATLFLGFVMIGWMLLMMALAAFGGALTSSGGGAISLGRGVTVTPISGWSAADDVWNMGSDQVAFKRAGAVVVFAVDGYEGDTETLLDARLAGVNARFASFRSLPASPLTVAGRVPALRVLFNGVLDSGRLEGELVAATQNDTAVVMLAVAPFGQLRRVQEDLDTMLQTMVVP